MPYRFELQESVPQAIRRIARHEIGSAVAQLSGAQAKNRDESIHEARKSIKKTRGLLRLVQPELGTVYLAETTGLRESGRKLSAFRDARAILDTFDELSEKYKDKLREHTLHSVRAGLMKRKNEAEKHGDIELVLSTVASRLRATARRISRWPLKTDGFSAIGQGLQDTFRRGRQGLARVKEDPQPATFHEWRKRAKELWYHTRLLENLWCEEMQAQAECLKELENWLGTHHNLAVLQERIATEPGYFGDDAQIRLVLESIALYQEEIGGKSVSVGKRIYNERPRQYTRRMGDLWEICHSEITSAAGTDTPVR